MGCYPRKMVVMHQLKDFDDQKDSFSYRSGGLHEKDVRRISTSLYLLQDKTLHLECRQIPDESLRIYVSSYSSRNARTDNFL